MVPVTLVMPRVGSLPLALGGRTRNVHEAPRGASAGRSNLVLQRIFETLEFTRSK